MMISAPWSSSALAASASLPGSNQVLTPDDLHLDVRIDALRAQHRRIDAGDHLWNRERADIAEHAGLRHFRGDLALDVAALIPARRIGRHVLVALVAGRMFEMHIGIFPGDLQRRVHVAEGGGEDQLVAGAHELLDRTFGVRTFADVLQVSGLDLVAEFLDQRLARDFVLVGPAEISNRAEIDEAYFELVGGGCAEQACSGRDHHRRRRNENFSHGSLRYKGMDLISRRARAPSRAARVFIDPARTQYPAPRARSSLQLSPVRSEQGRSRSQDKARRS